MNTNSSPSLAAWVESLLSDRYREALPLQTLNGVPLLVQEPARFVGYWKWQSGLMRMSQQSMLTKMRRERVLYKQEKIVLERVDRILEAHEFNIDAVAELLGELSEVSEGREQLANNAGVTNLEISKNFENLYRDWAWPTGEIEAHLEAFMKSGFKPEKNMKVLVVAGGAGRFAFEVFKAFGEPQMVVTEINPLLVSVANKLLQGESVELYETPPYPFETQKSSKLWQLKTQHRARENFQLVYQDFNEDVFVPGSFDVVLTPWFIDVVDLPIEKTIQKIATLLKPGGTWLNFGPLYFQSSSPLNRWTFDEVRQLSSKLGFAVTEPTKTRVPQICSPQNSNGRYDDVFTWAFQRTEKPLRAENLIGLARTTDEPDYLTQIREPVRLNVKLDAHIQTHLLMADVLTEAKANKSVLEIAMSLARKYEADPNVLVPTVQALLKDFYRLHIQ